MDSIFFFTYPFFIISFFLVLKFLPNSGQKMMTITMKHRAVTSENLLKVFFFWFTYAISMS